MRFTALAAGSDFTLGLLGNGSLMAWGDNFSGQLGVGDTKGRTEPARVLTPAAFSVVAASNNQVVAIRADTGSLMAWGVVPAPLNDPWCTSINTPKAVEMSKVGQPQAFTALSGGSGHFCAIQNTTNYVYCCECMCGCRQSANNPTIKVPMGPFLCACCC
jgi:alpha-tubulin suppressor-like RCC1 family protein